LLQQNGNFASSPQETSSKVLSPLRNPGKIIVSTDLFFDEAGTTI
jgi:hypothetical protein